MPGSELQRTLTRLVYRKNNEGRRLEPENKPGVPAGVGVGVQEPAGIASPLTEQDAQEEREYHPKRPVQTSDGIFTLYLEPVKRVRMLDANGREVVFIYDDPEPPPEE